MKIFHKECLSNGRRNIYFCGLKIFTYSHSIKRKIRQEGENNHINISDKNVNVECKIIGNNNTIDISEAEFPSYVKIFIHGNNNKIHIVRPRHLAKLNISIGNHVEINNADIFIDELVGMVGVDVIIEQHWCKLKIGKKCLFSKNILIRMGEIPHLVFDADTKEYVDTPAELLIGNHVWVGEGVTILKKARIGNDCIVGTRAVVTKEIPGNNIMIAGNPATIKRRNVYWVQNENAFEKDEYEYQKNYEQYLTSGTL